MSRLEIKIGLRPSEWVAGHRAKKGFVPLEGCQTKIEVSLPERARPILDKLGVQEIKRREER